jgi:hypothetical protein
MNNVAAIRWALAKLKERGAAVTLGELDQSLGTDSLPEAEKADCREWLDAALTLQGPEHRAMDALVVKLTTIGSAITERLNRVALEQLSVPQMNQLMEGYLDFKQVIESVLPKR